MCEQAFSDNWVIRLSAAVTNSHAALHWKPSGINLTARLRVKNNPGVVSSSDGWLHENKTNIFKQLQEK